MNDPLRPYRGFQRVRKRLIAFWQNPGRHSQLLGVVVLLFAISSRLSDTFQRFASDHPLEKFTGPYPSVAISIIDSSSIKTLKLDVPFMLNTLTPCSEGSQQGFWASSLSIKEGAEIEVDITKVDCIGYGDVRGMEPVTEHFNLLYCAMTKSQMRRTRTRSSGS
jgi:hypothetical protein